MKCTISWSLPATLYWLKDEMEMNDQSFFAGDMLIHLLCPSLIKDRFHFVRDTAAEKELSLKILNIRGVFRTQLDISDGIILKK